MRRRTAAVPGCEWGRLCVVETRGDKIRELSQRAAQMAQPAFRELERRSLQRVPYPRLIRLTPLNDQDWQPVDSPIFVVGKHLSLLGLDFFHHEPIPQRFVVASLEAGDESWIHFVLKIDWCRFLKPHWYDGGGRFVKVVRWCEEPEIFSLHAAEID